MFDRLDGLPVDELDAAAAQLSGPLRDRWPECRLERLERRGIQPTPIPSTR